MISNKQDILELKEGDLFTAVLPSREKLLKMFHNETDDICIKEFINGLRYASAYAYLLTTSVYSEDSFHQSWIRGRVLEGDTLLLCEQLRHEGTAPFGMSYVLEILHSDAIKDTEEVAYSFGHTTPYVYNGILTNITKISSGIII